MYTIKIKSTHLYIPGLLEQFRERVEASRFKATFERQNDVTTKGKTFAIIHVKPVRLKTPKPYCGQHPGECAVGARRNGRWLEWEDWVEFHNLINDVLDDADADVDVYTKPPEKMDKGSLMWVRRERRRRYRWEWDSQATPYGREIQIWNHGTPDQFERER